MLKVLHLPVKPQVRKYLLAHLGEEYVLSKNDRFGLYLSGLLQRQPRGQRGVGKLDKCTEKFAFDLRNYPTRQFRVTGASDYTISQFNGFVDDLIHQELYFWVRANCGRVMHRLQITEAILSFCAIYDIQEEELPLQTLKKAVQRNAGVRVRKRKKQLLDPKKTPALLSSKTAEVSLKTAELSLQARMAALRQHVATMPLPIIDLLHGNSVR
ncbi:hypothetical protein [Hymenobacter pini]|uniref:hypothetical protein n=1 Tax=Hymenobacter pini TaxID=2880879 RepID=UPI001CF4491A|nr:hypothetical protein [Hymenobacter pini]MCA8830545.1 hypothetical protein [Hymenobacter pini]